MCYARTAAAQINAYCRLKWPEKGYANMASTWCNGSVIDAYDHTGHMTHKYFPSDKITEMLGEPIGAGTYGAWNMKDGSLLLRTCKGPLAWAAKNEAGELEVQWGEFA